MTPVRLEPAALRSRVKHSTTERLRSRGYAIALNLYYTVLTTNSRCRHGGCSDRVHHLTLCPSVLPAAATDDHNHCYNGTNTSKTTNHNTNYGSSFPKTSINYIEIQLNSCKLILELTHYSLAIQM